MKVNIDDGEMAVAMLNGLPERFYPLITALDALGDDKTFTLEFVKSRLLQEEQRYQQLVESSLHKTKEKELVSKSYIGSCSGCDVKSIKSCSYCVKLVTVKINVSPNTRISSKSKINVKNIKSKHLLLRYLLHCHNSNLTSARWLMTLR